MVGQCKRCRFRRVKQYRYELVLAITEQHIVGPQYATRRILRPYDVLFRYSEDQFIAILLHTPEATAFALADHLRESISGPPGSASSEISITISVAVAPRDSSSFEGLLSIARERRTDAAMPKNSEKPNNRVH